MTEITNSEKIKVFSEETYWEQLDSLFKAYKLQEKTEKIKRKLKQLEKGLKKNTSNQNIQRLKALQVLVKEIVQKKGQIYSQILDFFNIFKIREQVNNLRGYISELNKAFKRKKIDVNTYRITYNHYYKQLNLHLKNYSRLILLAKEYILILKNEEIELNADYNFNKVKKLGKKSRSDNTDFMNMKKVIKQKIKFLNTEIINNSKENLEIKSNF